MYVYVLHAAQILDYTQYYLNLPEANSIGKANWIVEYSLLDYYELQEISAITLHDLADRFTQSNDYAFVRYVCDEMDRSIRLRNLALKAYPANYWPRLRPKPPVSCLRYVFSFPLANQRVGRKTNSDRLKIICIAALIAILTKRIDPGIVFVSLSSIV